jgi:hypothetical protein
MISWDISLKTMDESSGWSSTRTIEIGTDNQREAIKRAVRAAVELCPDLIGVQIVAATKIERP